MSNDDDDPPDEATTTTKDSKESNHPSVRKKESKKKMNSKKKGKRKKKKCKESKAPINGNCHQESSRDINNDDVNAIPSNNNNNNNNNNNSHSIIVAAQVELKEINAKNPSNTDVEKLNNSMSERGFSWGAAFAAASKIQPPDLGEQFIDNDTTTTTTKTTTTTITAFDCAYDDDGETQNHGVVHVSHLAQEYTSTRKENQPKEHYNVPMRDIDEFATTTTTTDAAAAAATKRKPKRKIRKASENDNIDNEDEIAIAELDHSAGESLEHHLKEQGTTKCSVPDFPYPTNPDDHCETPLQSYLDILPILNTLSKRCFGGEKRAMRIYDPYYCDGSVLKHLSSLGYTNVYNKKEDCYAVWEKSNYSPPYDVLITNPPYSEDHIEKLMNYVTSPTFGSKPWLLLMPQWVHKKDYYLNAISRRRGAHDGTKSTNNSPLNPFYIVPRKRYVYLPPANFREKKESDVHKKSSPFVSMWYCWGGDWNANEELINEFRNSSSRSSVVECDLARSKSALRDLRRSGSSRDSKKFKTGK